MDSLVLSASQVFPTANMFGRITVISEALIFSVILFVFFHSLEVSVCP